MQVHVINEPCEVLRAIMLTIPSLLCMQLTLNKKPTANVKLSKKFIAQVIKCICSCTKDPMLEFPQLAAACIKKTVLNFTLTLIM